jgi:HEAT repeat protein
LWESEDPNLMAPFITFMQDDSDPLVRAAAASALGRYVYLGMLEELPASQIKRVEKSLLNVIHGEDELEVRRRALEALAYSSRPEVAELIAAAYHSDDAKMRVSAVFAMGRTSDAGWTPQVRAELESPEPEMRFEAARAAGEMELADAEPALAELAGDPDRQVSEAAIWSLSQVGGDFARETLTQLLEQADDEDTQDFIEEALDNLDFTDEVQAFSMFKFEPSEDDELDPDENDSDADEDEPE